MLSLDNYTSVDVQINAEQIFGLPSRIGSYEIGDTEEEPYYMSATDHFDDTKPLRTVYGAVTLVKSKEASIFWDNPSDTLVTVKTKG